MRKEEIIKLAQQIEEGRCEPEELWSIINSNEEEEEEEEEEIKYNYYDDDGDEPPTWDDEFEYYMSNL